MTSRIGAPAGAGVLRRAALVLAWVLWLPGSEALAQPLASDLDAALAPWWDHLPDRRGWRPLVSPAFPATWPPAPTGRLAVVRYAFAMRLAPGIADGAEMAAPWAKATLGADGAVVIEPLSSRLQPIGIQGVRPLGPGEGALVDREGEMAERLARGGGAATDRLVRDVTCSWIGRQGVVAAAITSRHPDFTRWLDCP